MHRDDQGDLEVPDERRGDQVAVHLVVRGPEQVEPGAQRIGDLVDQQLAIDGEGPEVVGHQVAKGNRDQ